MEIRYRNPRHLSPVVGRARCFQWRSPDGQVRGVDLKTGQLRIVRRGAETFPHGPLEQTLTLTRTSPREFGKYMRHESWQLWPGGPVAVCNASTGAVTLYGEAEITSRTTWSYRPRVADYIIRWPARRGRPPENQLKQSEGTRESPSRHVGTSALTGIRVGTE